jgi:hypothetical protein
VDWPTLVIGRRQITFTLMPAEPTRVPLASQEGDSTEIDANRRLLSRYRSTKPSLPIQAE